ncbi:VOC family protein [Alteromonas sp. BMJM2]|uniref:VOC family protein n=1 Tax=Alteromonas sp. BMJM2 TaxID=2954241 RepID=UPI0022B49579|nr:VOC family protein [Alteromonas sp. BMJM2]
MLAYSTIGVTDMARATAFYDELLAIVGAKQSMIARDGDFVAYGSGEGALFGLAVPFNGQAATPGNGNMIAIAADSPQQIQALYDKALSLGATDAGAPGPRADGAFSCGYVYDLDGNKLNFFSM